MVYEKRREDAKEREFLRAQDRNPLASNGRVITDRKGWIVSNEWNAKPYMENNYRNSRYESIGTVKMNT